MAFIDNPIISALGNSLGLGGVFAAAGSPTPSGDSPAPNSGPPPKAGASKPNQPESHNRFWVAPNQMGKGPGGGGPGTQSGVMPGPMSQDTLQSPQVQALLGQYGVHPSGATPDPNLFIHNPQAFVNHPVLAGILERTMRGLAGAHEGKTFMDSLSGTLQGGQEEDVKSAQQVNNQLMAPIQQASAIQQLQRASDEHSTAMADSAYKTGMLHVYQQNAETKQERAAHFPLQKNPDGTMSRWNPEGDNGNGAYEVDPTVGRDEELYQKNQYYQGAMHQLALSKYNGDVTKITPEDIASVHSNWDTMQSRAKGAASEDNNKRTTSTAIATASIRAANKVGANVEHMSIPDKEALKNIDKYDSQLDQVAKSSQPFTTPEGRMLLSPKAKTAWVQAEKAKVADARGQVVNKYGKSASPSPSSSLPSSPMTAQPQSQYEPGFIPLKR